MTAQPAEIYSRAMIAAGATLGFAPPTAEGAAQGRLLAADLIGLDVAPTDTILSVLTVQPASSLIAREGGAIVGIVATLLLTFDAQSALMSGLLDGFSPQPELVARPDQPVGFYYIWGVAGATKMASARAMLLSWRLRYGPLANLTAYTRAATPMGRRAAVKQLGFEPVRRPDDDLLTSRPTERRWAA